MTIIDNLEYTIIIKWKREEKTMKVCHTEAMKKIKEYEEQKRILISKEYDNSTISYKEGEEKLANNYDYKKTRANIAMLDKNIRDIRAKLAYANCTVKVEKFDVTIGEALVMLAQMQQEKRVVESLSYRTQLSRRITTNGILEYTECLYNPEDASLDAEALREKISDLQIAIDKANLTNEIDI